MRGAAFVALTPAMTALLAIPILGEWPSAVDWMAIGLISLGVHTVSGGPLAAPRVPWFFSAQMPRQRER
jgi:drug/metabolite transporter (DMT)-like permease